MNETKVVEKMDLGNGIFATASGVSDTVFIGDASGSLHLTKTQLNKLFEFCKEQKLVD
jgi:hypothetical protein